MHENETVLVQSNGASTVLGARMATMSQEPMVRWAEVEELLSMMQCAFQFKGRAIEVSH